jgi:protein LSM12
MSLATNKQASPQGQLVFDKLLKACSEAVWKGESILVLKQVQVDPPYGPEHCKIVQRNSTSKKATLEDGSLERIQKIVAAAANNNNNAAS